MSRQCFGLAVLAISAITTAPVSALAQKSNDSGRVVESVTRLPSDSALQKALLAAQGMLSTLQQERDMLKQQLVATTQQAKMDSIGSAAKLSASMTMVGKLGDSAQKLGNVVRRAEFERDSISRLLVAELTNGQVVTSKFADTLATTRADLSSAIGETLRLKLKYDTISAQQKKKLEDALSQNKATSAEATHQAKLAKETTDSLQKASGEIATLKQSKDGLLRSIDTLRQDTVALSTQAVNLRIRVDQLGRQGRILRGSLLALPVVGLVWTIVAILWSRAVTRSRDHVTDLDASLLVNPNPYVRRLNEKTAAYAMLERSLRKTLYYAMFAVGLVLPGLSVWLIVSTDIRNIVFGEHKALFEIMTSLGSLIAGPVVAHRWVENRYIELLQEMAGIVKDSLPPAVSIPEGARVPSTILQSQQPQMP